MEVLSKQEMQSINGGTQTIQTQMQAEAKLNSSVKLMQKMTQYISS